MGSPHQQQPVCQDALRPVLALGAPMEMGTCALPRGWDAGPWGDPEGQVAWPCMGLITVLLQPGPGGRWWCLQ